MEALNLSIGECLDESTLDRRRVDVPGFGNLSRSYNFVVNSKLWHWLGARVLQEDSSHAVLEIGSNSNVEKHLMRDSFVMI